VKLICRSKVGDSRTKDHDTLAAAKIQFKFWQNGFTGSGHEAKRVHRGESCGVAAHLGDALDKDTPGKAHDRNSFCHCVRAIRASDILGTLSR
jgi:hypothetical protein